MTTMHTEGPLRVGLVGQQAWANATELITGPELPDGTRHSNDAWAIGKHGLYHMVPGQPGIVRVPAGHIGGRVIQQLADLADGRA